METVEDIRKKYNIYIPAIKEEDLIAWIEAFLVDLKNIKAEFRREKQKLKVIRFLNVLGADDDRSYYDECIAILNEGIRITLVMKAFFARIIPIISNKNAQELFKLMKYASDYFYDYVEFLDRKLTIIDTKYSGINITYTEQDTKSFEQFMSDQVDQEEINTIPIVPNSEMLKISAEYESYVVNEKFAKSTEGLIFLWMCLDDQVKYLGKKAKRFAYRSEMYERLSNYFNSKEFEQKSNILEGMQIITEEEADILAYIRSATHGDNLDEMRKLSDFSIDYYSHEMQDIDKTVTDPYYNTRSERRRATIKRFVMSKVEQTNNKQLIK